jgi:hypothetical protein
MSREIRVSDLTTDNKWDLNPRRPKASTVFETVGSDGLVRVKVLFKCYFWRQPDPSGNGSHLIRTPARTPVRRTMAVKGGRGRVLERTYGNHGLW